MKLRVYLDTSVFSAYCDSRVTDRQAATEEFWARREDFDLATSETAREELAEVPDEAVRTRLWALLQEVKIEPVTQEMRELARHYIGAGVFSPVMLNDALHVAAAVLTRQDVVLSWNFKHLVNRRRRAQVNQVNISLGLATVEIVAPPEV